MRKVLGFLVLFGLGFLAGAYVLRTYFPSVAPAAAPPTVRDESAKMLLTSLETSASEAQTAPPTSFETMLRTASQRISRAVVNVDTTGEVRNRFGMVMRVGGQGSGVIISPDGYIVTNNHVIRIGRDVAPRIIVTLQDGRRFTATPLGTDSQNDLALLKIDGKNLPAAQFGDSDKLQVGDWVIAVGNPFGLGHTVTAGIVSAINRNIEGAGGNIPSGFIQTDAAINQGNSGGALADSRGRLVGINTAIFSPVGANVGIGFAIPISRVRQVVREILEHGSVGQAWLGISYGDLSDPELRRILSQDFPDVQFPRTGMLIGDVLRNSPAYEAGIRPGDVIVSVNGRQVTNIEQMQQMMRRMRPGERVKLRLWRDGSTRDIEVVLGVRPEGM
ncbi:MAG: trypsin-like peptidase domain-containing protein [Fimbriimonadales bacterium]